MTDFFYKIWSSHWGNHFELVFKVWA